MVDIGTRRIPLYQGVALAAVAAAVAVVASSVLHRAARPEASTIPEQTVRRYLAAGDNGDYATLNEVLAEGVVTHATGGRRLEGREAAGASWKAAHDGLSDLRHDIGDIVATGGRVAVRVRVSGIHTGAFLGIAPTRARMDVDMALFARVESGRIVEMWEIADTGLALRQLGVLGGQRLTPGVD